MEPVRVPVHHASHVGGGDRHPPGGAQRVADLGDRPPRRRPHRGDDLVQLAQAGGEGLSSLSGVVVGEVDDDLAGGDVGQVRRVEAAQVPLVDPRPHVLPHPVRRQPLQPLDVRRVPPERVGVDLLQLGVGAVELVAVGRLQADLVTLDHPHAGLGQARQQLVLGGLLHAQPFRDQLEVVLADEDLRLEVVDGGQHGPDRRARIVAVAADPAGHLGVGLGPLQQRVAADQLDLVEQDNPSPVPGGGDQARARTGSAARRGPVPAPPPAGRWRLPRPPSAGGAGRRRAAGRRPRSARSGRRTRRHPGRTRTGTGWRRSGCRRARRRCAPSGTARRTRPSR